MCGWCSINLKGRDDVDTATINHVSLCSGYGGIDLGLSRAMGGSLRTIAYSEIEAFACANLVSKMEAGLLDPAPIWSDLKTFPWQEFRGLVDIVSGGYPCQPFSAAGKRAGKDDPRHLWPWIADGIRIARPRLCFFENVEGHISLGLSTVISDLEELGYRTTFGIFSASEVGAPHQRKRVFILAHRSSDGHDGRPIQDGVRGWRLSQLSQPHIGGRAQVRSKAERCGDVWPSRPGGLQHGWEPPRIVSNQRRKLDNASGNGHGKNDPVSTRRESAVDASNLADSLRWQHGRPYGFSGRRRKPCKIGRDAAKGRSESDGIQQTQPSMGGDANGSAHRLDHAELYVTSDNRTDELRLLGNGVVPATAEKAFRVLWAELQASG
jgi:DNA (cytosine-5)-methyltransferase 1